MDSSVSMLSAPTDGIPERACSRLSNAALLGYEVLFIPCQGLCVSIIYTLKLYGARKGTSKKTTGSRGVTLCIRPWGTSQGGESARIALITRIFSSWGEFRCWCKSSFTSSKLWLCNVSYNLKASHVPRRMCPLSKL